MFRVAVGGVEHETAQMLGAAGFTTEFEHFAENSLGGIERGEEVLALRGSNSIVAGFLDGCDANGLAVVPLCYAKARTGGPVNRATLDRLVDEVMTPLRAALPVDGVLLSLHGAFCAEDRSTSSGEVTWREDDADGFILAQVRQLVGPTVPVFSVHDLHCNVSQKMVDAADMLVVERTYPHVDMAERAQHAAFVMAKTLAGEVNPTMAWCSLPILWSAKKMIETQEPFRSLIEKLEDLRPSRIAATLAGGAVAPSAAQNLGRRHHRGKGVDGILSASVGVGFQWADSPTNGAATIVVADGSPAAAQQHAIALADFVWEHRAEWDAPHVTKEAAVSEGQINGEYPIVIADQGDNTGGGAPGDATHILRMFVENKLEDAVVLYVVDPETAALAAAAGAGATGVCVQVGGKSHERLGPPVPMKVDVLGVTDGRFRYDGPMWQGREDCLGTTVWLRQGGVELVVISEPQQPIDLALCRTLGLDVATKKFVCVKSTGHFRSGFEAIAGRCLQPSYQPIPMHLL
jgi:microcystin degradation protein MlrC